MIEEYNDSKAVNQGVDVGGFCCHFFEDFIFILSSDLVHDVETIFLHSLTANSIWKSFLKCYWCPGILILSEELSLSLWILDRLCNFVVTFFTTIMKVHVSPEFRSIDKRHFDCQFAISNLHYLYLIK